MAASFAKIASSAQSSMLTAALHLAFGPFMALCPMLLALNHAGIVVALLTALPSMPDLALASVDMAGDALLRPTRLQGGCILWACGAGRGREVGTR